MKICTVMADGFEDTEFTTVYDCFIRAGYEVDCFSAGKDSVLRSSHGLTLTGFKPESQLVKEDYDMIFLPGGKKNYDTLSKDALLAELLPWFLANRKVAAICAAPALLGHLGLLKGRSYTCYTTFHEEAFQGHYSSVYCVHDGNLYTGRSMAASLEFALMIIRDLSGEQALSDLEDKILY